MPATATAIVLVLVVGGVLWWQPWVEQVEPASKERMAFPLPEKPSIAVLPFDNLAGVPEQDYFADGISESIITSLSNVPALFVIARSSTFTYKGKPVRVQQVAEELGVRYVLEGSVQKSDDRVRITAQLIDALNGRHLWSERYDRSVTDVFDLQDEITQEIVTALQVQLTEGDLASYRLRRGTKNIEAWELDQQALRLFRRLNKEDNTRAKELARKSLELDPNYVHAIGLLAYCHFVDVLFGWSETPAASFERAFELAQRALALDDSNADILATLGRFHLHKREYDKAVELGAKSVELSPNHAIARGIYAIILINTGRPDDGIVMLNQAMRLSPYLPDLYRGALTRAYRLTGRFDESIAASQDAIKRNPNMLFLRVEATATYSAMGREAEAKAAAAEVLRIKPKFSVNSWAKTWRYKDATTLERELEHLRRAGLSG